ncbi:MAG TPA: tripartite tricarboxylate transporter TctB family protein [Ancylobacter sp.]
MIEIRRRTAEIVTALALLAAIVFLYIHTYTFAPSPMRGYPGAAFMPRLILIYSGAFTAIWLGGLLFRHATPIDDPDPLVADAARFEFEYRNYFVTAVAILAFVFGIDQIGFELTCFLIFVVLLYSRLSSLAMVIGASLITTIFCYVVFVLLLNVSLPLAFLPAYINF